MDELVERGDRGILLALPRCAEGCGTGHSLAPFGQPETWGSRLEVARVLFDSCESTGTPGVGKIGGLSLRASLL